MNMESIQSFIVETIMLRLEYINSTILTAIKAIFDGFYGGTDPGNLWEYGCSGIRHINMYQTNSIYARSELNSGNGAYFVTGGTGNRTWSFYDGGANSNGNGSLRQTERHKSQSTGHGDLVLSIED